jgi:N-acetylglutamate synthase-like GNAT family acetyltransferase
MQADSYEISTDRERLDVGLIHEFLRSSYWARGVPREVVEKSIRNSLCFGAFLGRRQVGFARVVSDFATMAYVADVFVLPAHRGRGVSKRLMQVILAHPELQGLRRVLLATRDAHGLYDQFGFEALTHPEYFMTIHKPDVYTGGEPGAGEAGQTGGRAGS